MTAPTKLQPAHAPTLVYAIGAALLVLCLYHFTAHHRKR